MKLKEMRAKVLEELEHIPIHPKAYQGELRMLYWMARMNSLGKKAKGEKTATDVLQKQIKLIGKDYPGVEFRYDREFFKAKANRKKGY